MQPDGTGSQEQQWLLSLRYRDARPIEAGGDRPISLDDPDAIFVVSSGKVDVFSTQADVGQTMGPRRHLCRIEAGQLLFGMDLSQATDGFRMVAVGVADTVLLELRRPKFLELAEDPAYAARVGPLLEGWVANMSAAATGQRLPPKESEMLASGPEIALGADDTVRAQEGTVWVRHLEGESRFLGDPDLPPIAGGGFFPLSDPAWLDPGDGTTLLGVDTEDFLALDGALSALDGFHAMVLSALALDTRRSYSERREREHERDEGGRKLARDAVERLSAVLETPKDVSPDGVTGDLLLAACWMVGRSIGVELRRPAYSGGMARDPLEEISRASRVRIRRVVLDGDWWRADNGPLLGFLGEDERPVALLPRGTAAYAIVDPVDGTRQNVTGETASELAPFGYTFYAPFPDRPLGTWDLLRYSLRGLRGDLLRVLLMGAAGGLLGAIVPIVTKQIVDFAIPEAAVGLAVALALGLVVAAISAMLFEVTRQFAVVRIETKLDAGLQAAVWDRLLSLPAPFFRDYSAGDLAVRALGINTIRQMVTGATISSLLSGVFSVFSFAVIFYYSVQLGLIAVLMAAVILGVTVAGGLVQLRYQRRETEMMGKVSSLVLQLLTGIAKLRVAGAEMRVFAVWAGQYSIQKANTAKAQSAANAVLVFNSASSVLTSLVVFAAVVFYLGGA